MWNLFESKNKSDKTPAANMENQNPVVETNTRGRGEIFDYKVWECIVCGFVYDEYYGCPEEGLAPGTHWADIPDDWSCPDCGVAKEDFEMIECSRLSAAQKKQFVSNALAQQQNPENL